jgi:hypothetical protein
MQTRRRVNAKEEAEAEGSNGNSRLTRRYSVGQMK